MQLFSFSNSINGCPAPGPYGMPDRLQAGLYPALPALLLVAQRLAYVPGSHRMLTPGFEVVAAPPLGSVSWLNSRRCSRRSSEFSVSGRLATASEPWSKLLIYSQLTLDKDPIESLNAPVETCFDHGSYATQQQRLFISVRAWPTKAKGSQAGGLLTAG